ncbi:MAG TPA: hypothetical protein VLJ11_10305 [Bryobacteraceae bacterium]|nr:hypothetical protein [Bryobacteraceae bacterium]
MTQTLNCWSLFRLQKSIAAKLPAVTIDTVYDTSLITAGLLVLVLLLNA